MVLSRRRFGRRLLATAAAIVAGFHRSHLAAWQGVRAFTVTATRGDFKVENSDKKEIRVTLGELVRITFIAQDIPHSFTTVETSAHYRIDRRAEPGKPVTFDFRADRAGTVPIQCRLTIDPKCKDMTMHLIVVEPK
jgi:heme/copper-type cytochrome/quinol oxidase subunit 2